MEEKKQTWDHQPPAIDYLVSHENTLLWAVMGSGKSKIIIETLRRKVSGGAKKFVILCPSAVLGVWRGQFATHSPEQFDVVILDKGTSKDKGDELSAGLLRSKSGGLPLVVVVNYETFWREAVRKQLFANSWDSIISDESHRIKAWNSRCSKEAWWLGKKCGARVGMTGTPMPDTPLDIFGQYRFLDDRIFGRYKTYFLNEYAIMDKYIPQKVAEWVNQDDMHARIAQIRYYIPSSVLVLPDKQDITIEVPLSPSGRRIYNEMKRHALAEVKQMITSAIGKFETDVLSEEQQERIRLIVAGNGAVKFLRMLQLAQGYSKDEDGEEVDTDTAKRRALLDLLEDVGEPVCVYGFFKHDMRVVEDCCRILGLRYGELSGSRKDLTSHAKYPEDIDVLAVQCKSGSSGIDLTRSRIGIVMNSGMISPGDYDQMIARQYRPGQTKNTIYYHLVTPNTVDETITIARQEKRDIVSAILKSREFF